MILLKFKNPTTKECFGVEVEEENIFDVIDEIQLHGGKIIGDSEFEGYVQDNEIEDIEVDEMRIIQTKYKSLAEEECLN